MTVGSLFSGIGGLELGLEMCGVGPVLWQAECDPYALAVLEHHWPTVKRYTDVRDIDASAARVDLVCGGFPCQDISSAGAKKGISGPRSGLWKEFARVLGVLRPRYVFVENVGDLVQRGLSVVLGDLAELGFDAEWDRFSAAETGAPHRRARFFLLAHTSGIGASEPDLRRAAIGWTEADGGKTAEPSRTPPIGADCVPPDVDGLRELQPQRREHQGWRWTCHEGRRTPEPPVPGVDDGVPGRVDSERLLGNAVVPQQAALAFSTLAARLVRKKEAA